MIYKKACTPANFFRRFFPHPPTPNCYPLGWLMQEKPRETTAIDSNEQLLFSVIRSFLLFIPCCANARTRSSLLPRKSFFRASVYLFSFSSLSFSLSFFFFISRWNPTTEALLCKAIFNPFWRPFSPSFFESFVAPSCLSPPSVPFRFHRFVPSPTLSRTLCLFLS